MPSVGTMLVCRADTGKRTPPGADIGTSCNSGFDAESNACRDGHAALAAAARPTMACRPPGSRRPLAPTLAPHIRAAPRIGSSARKVGRQLPLPAAFRPTVDVAPSRTCSIGLPLVVAPLGDICVRSRVSLKSMTCIPLRTV